LGSEESIELTPWWDRPVVRDLGLSEDQLKQIREAVRLSRDQLISLRAEVRIAEGHLADAMSNERVDDGKARDAIENVIRARADLMRATSQLSLRVRQVLTYSQWQELRRRGAQRILPGIRARQRAGASN
jgi:Spy/CpxP family protein refolding chaperone